MTLPETAAGSETQPYLMRGRLGEAPHPTPTSIKPLSQKPIKPLSHYPIKPLYILCPRDSVPL